MYYESTRGGVGVKSSAEAIVKGIAQDGGLLVSSIDVKFSLDEIISLVDHDYKERALYIMSKYLDDFPKEDLEYCVSKAYNNENFDHEDIAHLKCLNDNASILELWHGPTCAFKDMALQIMPYFLTKSLKMTEEERDIVILTATSGDTGKAALEGFKNVSKIKVIVFFPEEGVSTVQKMQMLTQEGENVYVASVKGNFDDAQNGVKKIFVDEEFNKMLYEKKYLLSSANSINWGRLLPQIVYYFSAYMDLIKKSCINVGEKVNFVVPTGNFGNILAGYYAKLAGLPINKLICASNENNVLTDFINTGIYDKNREFKKTLSPSMDILISSNLERFLFIISNKDSKKVRYWMGKLQKEGTYDIGLQLKNKIRNIMWAGYSDDREVLKTIESVYTDYGYILDTHTAVAVDVYDKYVISTGDITKTVIVSTASPFKFGKSVAIALFGEDAVKNMDEFEILEYISKNTNTELPKGLKNLDKKEIRHKKIIERNDLKRYIAEVLFNC